MISKIHVVDYCRQHRCDDHDILVLVAILRDAGSPLSQPDVAGVLGEMAYRKPEKPQRSTSAGRVERNKIARMTERRKTRQQDQLHDMMRFATARVVSDVYTNVEALIEFEEARRFAMATDPPQAAAMVAATMGKCKVMGLIVDKQAVGKPGDFRKTREQVIEELREAVGEGPTRQFLKMIENMRRAYNGPVIDGEAEED